MNEALRDWVTNVADTFYCIGTVAGPHPYPAMVRDFQCDHRPRDARADAGRRRPPAGFADRLHRRRLQRHGPVPSVPRRALDRNLRRRSGRPRHPERPARGLDRRRQARRAARQPHLSADERRRPDRGSAFDLRRPRLSRHRSRACLAERHGPREILVGHRRRGGRGIPAVQQARRHHPGARAGACAGARVRAGADKAARIT